MSGTGSTPARQAHFYILTLQKMDGGAVALSTFSNQVTFPPSFSRADAFAWCVQDAHAKSPSMTDSVVVFFSLERNEV